MRLKILIIKDPFSFFENLTRVCLCVLFFTSLAYSQEYVRLEDIGETVSCEIKSEFAEMDSLEMTIFISFKIDSEGGLDSLWVNGEEPKSFDYDYFINSSKNDLIRLLYLNKKKDYLIRKKIFEILKNIRISDFHSEKFKGYYLLPISLNLKRGLMDFYYENHYLSMKVFFRPGIHQYYFLEPVAISNTSGKIKRKNKTLDD